MFEKKTKKNESKELTVDVAVEEQNDDISNDSLDHSEGSAKKALKSLRDELRERSAEDKAFDQAVLEEKKRLAAAREEAKKKNILRKIKFVDNKYAQAEKEQDELALKKFREVEQSKIDAARAERSGALVRENKKPITVAIMVIVVICVVLSLISFLKHKATITKNYDNAVECIMAEKYENAFDILKKMNHKDSQALCNYSEIQMQFDAYKGEPDKALAELTSIEGIENEAVEEQYQIACQEAKKAVDIQADIDMIDISSIDTISEDIVNKVNASIKDLDNRYEVLLDTEKFDIASRLFYNRDNNTDAWKLISELNELGDVTLDSRDTIDHLRKTYDSLSDEDRKTVLNYNILTTAESKYTELKKAEDERIAAEEKKKEEEERKRKEEEEERKRKEEKERKQAEEDAAKDNYTVFITSGDCYHNDGCSRMGSKGKRAVTQGWAIANGYYPCSFCFSGWDVPSYYYYHPE